MIGQSIIAPFPTFFDKNGETLESGSIYIGQSGLNPETSPINVFWDKDFLYPAEQPIRTINGLPSRSGTPSAIFTKSADYSILVQNKNKELIYSALVFSGIVSEYLNPVNTIADLKLVDVGSVDSNQTIDVKGATSVGDKGGGQFYWESTSTASNNDDTVIQATGVATGRWIRVLKNTITVDSIADLKIAPIDTNISILGYYVMGDGGRGDFYWDSSSTDADNGGTIIQATGVATGRWIRVLSNPVNIKWFGATGDGTTDDITAIDNAMASLGGNGGDVIFPIPASYWRTSATLTVPAGVRLIFLGYNDKDTLYNYIKPDAGVSPGIEVTRTKGVELISACIDATNLVGGEIAFDFDAVWWSKVSGSRVVNLSNATAIGVRIKFSDTPSDFGNYWNIYEHISITGSAGIGFLILGKSGAPRVNVNTFMNLRAGGITTGCDIAETGAGVVFINPNFEGNSGDGMTVGNISSGTSIILIGGEFSGNTGWGISGTGDVHAIDTVFAGNGSGDFGTNVTHQQGGNFTSSVQANFFIGMSDSISMGATDQITPSASDIRVGSTGGAVTLTSDPQITDGENAQVITLFGDDNVNYVTLVAGQGLRLSANFDLRLADSITLKYLASFGDWVEISRSDNS